MPNTSPSVSVVICCYNSILRLPQTLAHLAAQRRTDGIAWEVVVVDNASTDGTAETAISNWPDHAPAPLRVVSEPIPGLSHARKRGIYESCNEIISFVDDDNWVSPDWVRFVAEIMAERREVGACGGQAAAVCETPPPAWFDRFKESYAVGRQAEYSCEVPDTRGYLWGAGLSIRREALLGIINKGFIPLHSGRKGQILTAGEDAELCFALRLAGWRLWYDSRLFLEHFIPSQRLTWEYLRRLHRGFGACTVGNDPYRSAITGTRNGSKLMRTWYWQSLYLLGHLLKHHTLALLRFRSLAEGDDEVIDVEQSIGRLLSLLQAREKYERSFVEIQNAPWIGIVNSSRLAGEDLR